MILYNHVIVADPFVVAEPLEPNNNFADRISVKFSNLSEVATRPGPSLKLSALFLGKSRSILYK